MKHIEFQHTTTQRYTLKTPNGLSVPSEFIVLEHDYEELN